MKKLLVCFHVGRSGRNQSKKVFYGHVANFQSLLSVCDDLLYYTEDENGNALPDEEWTVVDAGGNIVLQGRREIEADTGTLDLDGIYDTTTVRPLEDCTEEELQLIIDDYNNGNYIDSDVLDAVCDMLEYTHLRDKRLVIDPRNVKYSEFEWLISFGDTTAFCYDTPCNRYQCVVSEISEEALQPFVGGVIHLHTPADMPDVTDVMWQELLALGLVTDTDLADVKIASVSTERHTVYMLIL
jgi:hypothetical protein